MFRFIEMILDALFTHEVIDGRRGIPYLHRWVLWRGREGRGIYLHRFVGSDWSRDLHDHPKDFVSIGLKGRYTEEWKASAKYPGSTFQVHQAPWFRKFPAEHIHRVILDHGETCWTLVKVGPKRRDWGFYYDDVFVPYEIYINSELADLRANSNAEF